MLKNRKKCDLQIAKTPYTTRNSHENPSTLELVGTKGKCDHDDGGNEIRRDRQELGESISCKGEGNQR